MKCSLVSLIFLKRFLVFSILLFSSISLIQRKEIFDHWGRLSYLSLLSFGTLHSNGYIFPFLLWALLRQDKFPQCWIIIAFESLCDIFITISIVFLWSLIQVLDIRWYNLRIPLGWMSSFPRRKQILIIPTPAFPGSPPKGEGKHHFTKGKGWE